LSTQAEKIAKKRLPWWVWLLSLACATWLGLALYGQLIRERRVVDPGAVREEAAAIAADKAGEPLPNTVQALGDLDLPPVRPQPVKESEDRGTETLLLPSERCRRLHETFQAKVLEAGQCEVYLHELRRQDGMLFIMASPHYGVRENGRPILAVLPESAYPAAE